MDLTKQNAVCPPDWLARYALYQINPRTFSPEGTLNAITKELPSLSDMGFQNLYICPVFEADDSEDMEFWSKRQKKSQTMNPKNPYRMNNYFRIDCEYGDEKDLRELIQTAHSLGQRVILDLVYMHIGPNAPIVKQHPEFVQQDENGQPLLTEYNFYLLNFESAGLREYLWCNMVYYITEYDVDGFRCDVGDEVPIDFWVEGRRRIQTIKQDAVLINEGAKWDYLIDGFDCMYNIPWHKAIYKVILGKADNSKLVERHREEMENMPLGAMIMRDMDNHDTVTDWPERIELCVGHAGMEAITVMNYMIDGIPMVYCGNELADCSHLSLFANRFHRGEFEATDRISLKTTEAAKRRMEIMKKLNAIKKQSDILRYGKTKWFDNSVLEFEREYQGGKIKMLVNLSQDKIICKQNLPDGEILFESEQKVLNEEGVFTFEPYNYLVIQY